MAEIPGVGWALWSKRAGTSSDYSVLSCSQELFGRADFAKIITRFAGGNPDSQATGSERLPWVTVSWVGVDANLRAGIAVTDNTGQVDAVGRPITATSYLCVPYQEAARAQLSYTALHAAVSRIRLPAQDGSLITLSVPAEPASEAVRRVTEDLDERIVAAAAALLLRGPVTVTQADGSTLEQRLAFIDAVASSLPFGLRAKFTAGTWSDSGIRHRLRLAFASRAREEGAVVSWRNGGEVTGDDVARQYHDQLGLVRGGTAAHGRKFDAATVIAHLAASTEQQKFEQSQEALTVLRLIDLPDRVLARARSGGPVDLAELRQAFRLGHLDAMAPDAKTDLLRQLSRDGDASDWPVLKAGLAQIEDSLLAWSILVPFGCRVLWSDTPADDVLGECMAAAHGRGIADNVLAGLVSMPDNAAGPSPAAQAAAGLIARNVPAAAGFCDFPATREALVRHPAATAEYLAALAACGQEAAQLLGWLGADLPAAMTAAFRTVFGLRRAELRPSDIAALAEIEGGCARALLAAAAATGRLEPALAAFTRWIMAYGELDPRAPAYWKTHLRPLSITTPRQRAQLDLALMSVSAAPSGPPPFRQPDAQDYLAGFLDGWKPLRKSPGVPRCVGALAKYLEKQPRWAEGRAQAEAVIALVEQLRRDDEENRLVAVVASGLNGSVSARQWGFAKTWLAEINAKAPDAVGAGLLNSLATVDPGTDARQVAALCLAAHRQEIREDAAFYRLADSGAIDTAQAACALLAALRVEFERAGEHQNATWNWCLGLAQEVMQGKFGQQVADGFRDLQSRISRQEMWLQLDVLRVIAERPDRSGQGMPELTDEERADLDQVREDIDLLVKKSPMSFLFKKVWRE
jgi:hypothetical protein